MKMNICTFLISAVMVVGGRLYGRSLYPRKERPGIHWVYQSTCLNAVAVLAEN